MYIKVASWDVGVGIILLTGVPGTGKSTIGSLLAKRFRCEIIEVGRFARERRLTLGWDEERESEILDIERVKRELRRELNNQGEKICVVVSLYPDLVPLDFVDKVVVLRCDPAILADRLKNRGYSKKKLIENIEAEIVDFCGVEARKVFPEDTIFEIDVSTLSPQMVVEKILAIVSEERFPKQAINWRNGPIVLQRIKREDP